MNTSNEQQDAIIEMKLRKQAGIALHKVLVYNDSFPSCLNCAHFNIKNGEQCIKFGARPPVETIIFSCGVGNWEAGLPF